ncbi:hypothetical protein [Aeromonas hydrophila]|uniref:hypothetical protein n=1 Tax=Aeromonas hydrophila TaxID=644 RepID=UPI003B9EFC23
MAIAPKNERNHVPSSSGTVDVKTKNVKDQINTLFSQQRELVADLQRKSVKVDIKSSDDNSALEWL